MVRAQIYLPRCQNNDLSLITTYKQIKRNEKHFQRKEKNRRCHGIQLYPIVLQQVTKHLNKNNDECFSRWNCCRRQRGSLEARQASEIKEKDPERAVPSRKKKTRHRFRKIAWPSTRDLCFEAQNLLPIACLMALTSTRRLDTIVVLGTTLAPIMAAKMEDDSTNGDPPNKSILLGGEDAMEEDEAVLPSMPPMETTGSDELISRIITPSPFSHHVTGPTASRFRNALSRVTTHPTSDVEAWQALITEAIACSKNMAASLHSVDADTHAKLDWIESCFGSLLRYFTYASSYYVNILEMLLAQSARVGEEGGPLVDYGMDTSQRALRCEAKAEAIFRKVLGVNPDGTLVDDQVGGMCTSSVDLWLLYIKKRVRDAQRQAASLPTMEEKEEFVRKATIDAYELAISHASFVYNNHVLWKQYLQYVKSWIPNPAITTDHGLAQKQMLQLRSLYQRLVTHPMTGLDQLWQEYETFERSQNEHLATALIDEFKPKYTHARSVYLERNRVYSVTDLDMTRLATPPVDEEDEDEDYLSKMKEEQKLLTLWKKRSSYERTNPERLTANELVQRVRQAYKEMACALSRHPEVWHMWSMWELLRTGAKDSEKVERAMAVLELAQQHVPDCTLLAYAQAQVAELYSNTPDQCMEIMERFLERSPNALGFILYQQMVRRYKGIQPARSVFSKARRLLLESAAKESSNTEQETGETAEAKKDVTEGETGAEGTSDTAKKGDNGARRMVTNRLDPTIGVQDNSTGDGARKTDVDAPDDNDESDGKESPGVITWQLYASHADMEHRLNHSPSVAARVYELGLRKHVSFLTKPAYIRRYAQLLLELGDTENLRALLTRAIAACEAEEGLEDEIAALWDMTLRFEAILSGADTSNISALQSVERKRHAALMGAELEDVSTGGMAEAGDAVVGIGSNKSTIADQLIRSEGYDISSNIVNGMSRTADVLDVMGLWGNGDAEATRRRSTRPKGDSADSLAGGKSDACYQRRQRFQNLLSSGLSTEAALHAEGGSKLLSARDRMQPSVQQSAASLAIQQSPEWLRPLLLLLPASKFRTAAMNKPPPHMIEMALSALRTNALPAERPAEESSEGDPRKRKREGGDSSDEENGYGGGGGYGSQFRSRQRKRQNDAAENEK